ncbi:MAG: LuxR C-terminal-related transcriptional regulator [Salinivirgaceae bacterium]|jgi:LuxR family maltose regulon positive regulatory protein|nr:LuxR C-terminal-related transcriptional regulator [Salinivirgaceae bacterium]
MLLTKLHIPSPGKNLVHRTALFNKLNEGLACKLILISAPAGFGKSTVVSDWINQYKIPAAWFSIDAYDNDIVNFISYIIASIQTLKKDVGESAFELLKSPNPPRPESIINLLINDIIGIDQDFILVLDDFHLISNPEIFNAISYLFEYLPQNIHVAIISRSDPNLPIAKLRSQHQLIEFRSADLSFTSNDIAVLFKKKIKTKLSADNIRSLELKTEGWIAGLQLAALSMQRHDDNSAFIDAFAGNNRYIMDYLIEEVLKVQSEEVKDFLLKTSILEQFSAPLCNAVLNRNDSQTILEDLENNNMFVFPLDAERNWYRYHHLFADLLKQRLLLSSNGNVIELHNKACDWYEQNKMFDLAIEHALAINNHEKCIRLLGEFVENMWLNGNHDAILKYGGLLPDNLIKTNPEFCLYYAWILIASGLISKAESYLISAELTINNTLKNKDLTNVGKQNNKELLGKISVALAYLHSHQEHSDQTLRYCDIAMENLSKDNTLWYGWAWFSYGVTYFAKGQLQNSIEAFNKAFDYGKKSGNIFLISTIAMRMSENEQVLGNYKSAYKRCSELLNLISEKGYAQITKVDKNYAALYFTMGVSQFSWAHFEEAFENIRIAYTLSRGVKDIYIRVLSLMVYSFVLKELGDADAENKMAELDEIMKQDEAPPFLISMYRGWKIYLLLDKNQLEEAQDLINEYGIKLDAEKTHINETLYSSYTRVLLMQNRLDEAESLLNELYTLGTEGGRIERIIELKILFASLNNIKGDKEKAIEYMIEAMEMASDQNLLSYFIFNISHIESMLHEVIKLHATKKTNIPQEYIDNLKQALENKTKIKKATDNVDLSSREIDTLKAIAEELSNQQIADKLFISLNTVKTHLKNIYLKLDVDNRKSAVEKAKELHLV